MTKLPTVWIRAFHPNDYLICGDAQKWSEPERLSRRYEFDRARMEIQDQLELMGLRWKERNGG